MSLQKKPIQKADSSGAPWEESKFRFVLSEFVDWLAAFRRELPILEAVYWRKVELGREGQVQIISVQRRGRDVFGRPQKRRPPSPSENLSASRSKLFAEFRKYKTTGTNTSQFALSKDFENLAIKFILPGESIKKLEIRLIDELLDTLGDLDLGGSISIKKTKVEFKKAAHQQKDAASLPIKPSKIWEYNFKGRSNAEKKPVLLKFIEDVYGDYFTLCRNEIRDYIRRNDPKLYLSLKGFGFSNLPAKFRMPSRDDRLELRIQKAAAGDYSRLDAKERRSVKGKIDRLEKGALKPKRLPSLGK
ncbi:hypothetical protein J2Y55_002137 [Bosea sp. BE125]|uniref:hypothetical protein n=1 Tax=Bosea sp. BE125 TaxID=2817909 RepID=UPI00285BAF5F|nr:hypothetical protein [Bosea sp. BE125]MDR6871129.1 hypothetical protein [Bosea sp. BE125]